MRLAARILREPTVTFSNALPPAGCRHPQQTSLSLLVNLVDRFNGHGVEKHEPITRHIHTMRLLAAKRWSLCLFGSLNRFHTKKT
jgi:hypothetical protein